MNVYRNNTIIKIKSIYNLKLQENMMRLVKNKEILGVKSQNFILVFLL